MPKREDIKTILLIGSGPIVIGQACEFDYSGTQACRALREEGYRVVLVNSNPATIMTDPEMADAIYVEPIVPHVVERIIEQEKPDALLPTLGGQTALNCAVELYKSGVLEKHGVEMIGANYDAIDKAEDRGRFKEAMVKIGIDVPRSGIAHNLMQAAAIAEEIGFPLALRPAFTMGGSGGGIAWNEQEYADMARTAINASPVSEVLIEEYLAGWKEYEMEVMRDHADNVVIICSIENLDPMGVHTGDSITVAPAQTLSDKEYQIMRDASLRIIREIGVDTGGSNIQFATDPKTGRMIVIEMNPRVSRSSALASKATGFPIAKIAAKLAVGYRLDELSNDITKKTPACFEPAIDYCVVKAPRFTFEKFPGTPKRLTTQMKSVGETMAIGRTFKEALQKALRGLETGHPGFGGGRKDPYKLFKTGIAPFSEQQLEEALMVPGPERIFSVRHAMLHGMSIERIYELSGIDPWFLGNMQEICTLEYQIAACGSLDKLEHALLWQAKRAGFSDRQIAELVASNAKAVRAHRLKLGVKPVYKSVDTCAAEFEAQTPYWYSSYEQVEELQLEPGPKRVMILGGGPNRIGQGIEFDYCCVHAAFACKELGFEAVMVNSNPETVSTDYDVSDHLFFEPLTAEDVLNIHDAIQPYGVILQFGGQTPLNLARELSDAGVKVLGTPVDAIERAEDREHFNKLIQKLGIKQPDGATATTFEGALAEAKRIGFPVLVRPSFVLGGRGMEIVDDEQQLERYMREAVEISEDRPVLIDKFLDHAVEADVDCICDGEHVTIAGLMEHIDPAGIHSGDSACSIPARTLSAEIQNTLREWTIKLAKALGVVGLMNVQYAIKDGEAYIIEANPRASRTVPYVAKVIGRPVAGIAAKVMLGESLKSLNFESEIIPSYWSVKMPIFPFRKFPGAEPLLGPEMRSTGEAMGTGESFGEAVFKSMEAVIQALPMSGTILLSARDGDKEPMIPLGKKLVELGYKLIATPGTARVLRAGGVEVRTVPKIGEGRPNLFDMIMNNEIDFIINTPVLGKARAEEMRILTEAELRRIPVMSTVPGAVAAVDAMVAAHARKPGVVPLKGWYAKLT